MSEKLNQRAYRVVKLFDLGQAPAQIQAAIRPVALTHVSKVDGTAIWEVTVGKYDWRDAPEEWSLHYWLRDNGASEDEIVLVQSDEAV
jgi:hypothetical protein